MADENTQLLEEGKQMTDLVLAFYSNLVAQ